MALRLIFTIIYLFLIQFSLIDTAYGEKPNPGLRLISLSPSNTLLIKELNAQTSLIGISSYCRQFYPQGNVVGDFTSFNLEKIICLKPDYILLVSGQEGMQQRLSNLDLTSYKLKYRHFPVLILPNHKISDITNNLLLLGRLTGKEALACAKERKFNSCLSDLKVILAGKTKFKVFYCLWTSPLLTPGNRSFLNDIINICGGTNITSYISRDYTSLYQETLIKLNPDYIFLPSNVSPGDFITQPLQTYLNAYKHHCVVNYPNDNFLSYPCLNIVEGIYWLALKLHPEVKDKLNKWYAKYRSI